MTDRINEIRDQRDFSKFLEEPSTRFMMSLIPAGTNPDAMTVLLEAAFKAGVVSGGATCAMQFLGAMMKNERKP